MARTSINSLIEALLRAQPSLERAEDDDFVNAVRAAAKANSYPLEKMPKPWNILRARFAVKAKLSGKNRRRLSKPVTNLVRKARHSALEAVAAYNNPMSPFRSGSFIVHMHIAWNSLLLGLFLQKGIRPHYLDPETSKPIMLNGEVRWWGLATCVKEYWKGTDCAASKNIEFFVGLRNQIEHSLMPELDLDIFGECQAHLINFETILAKEFGEEFALVETLAMSLQFSHLKHTNKNQAIRTLHAAIVPEIREYIERFRSSLSNDISSNMEYSFKVFLVPNTGNHRSKDSLAVEFVRYDTLEPDEADKYKRMVTLIKDRHVPVANLDKISAGEVAKRVAMALSPSKFTASTHHARCWKFYQVRPMNGDPNPYNCNSRYCSYDEAHRDYVYTEEWVEFLKKELSDPMKYKEVCGSKMPVLAPEVSA